MDTTDELLILIVKLQDWCAASLYFAVKKAVTPNFYFAI